MHRMGQTGVRGPLLALLGLVISAALAPPSSALVVERDGTLYGIQPTEQFTTALRPFSERKGPLEYHGGPVMPESTAYVIFWDPKGSPAYAPGYTAGVVEYFKDLAHDSGAHTNVQSVSEQYTDSEGAHAAYKVAFGGEILDKDVLPKNACKAAAVCLDARQLEAEVKKVVTGHGLPIDRKHIYFLLRGPNIEDCFVRNGSECSANTSAPVYCAYHGAITAPAGSIIWANDPYVYEKNCDEPGRHPRNSPGDAALLGGLSHEYNEALTDPELDAWYNGFGEGEIGDECRTFKPGSEFGPILGFASDGSPYNQVLNGHLYDYQQEWSNSGKKCKQHLP